MFKTNLKFLNFGGFVSKNLSGYMTRNICMPIFMKTAKKYYFSYPCPRKLREIVKITLFEREQPSKIKEIWQKYYEEKPHAIGFDIAADEMKLILEK
jgi:hypothetical protein